MKRFLTTVMATLSCSCPEQPALAPGPSRNAAQVEVAPVPSEAVAEPAVEKDGVCSLSEGELSEREGGEPAFALGASGRSELPDGFECRFPGSWRAKVEELVEKERACCSTLVFEVLAEPALSLIHI